MKTRQLILGAILSLAFIGSAGAATKTTNLGTLEDGNFGIVDNAFLFPQSFSDTVNFTLTSPSTISGFFLPIRLLSANWALASSNGTAAGGVLSAGSYSFGDLAPGSYTIALFGTSRALGGYAATYRVAVAAVPELETWLMMIIGAGLLAFQLHRKHRALGTRILSDDLPTPA